MKQVTIFLILSFLIFNLSYSQVSGYQGKHVLIKSDLSAIFPDRGYSAALEAAIFRKVSIEIDYRATNRKVNQIDFIEEDLRVYPVWQNDFDRDELKSFVRKKATTNEKVVNIGLKFFLNKAFTAPRGPYIYAKYGQGLLKFDLDFVSSEYDELLDRSVPTIFRYKVEKIPTYHIQYGAGLSYIFAKVIHLDMSWGLHHYRVGSVEKDYEASRVIHKIGPNIYNFSSLIGNYDPKGFGVSFRLSLGLLVF